MDAVTTPEQPAEIADSGSLSDHERTYHERTQAAPVETPAPSAEPSAEPAAETTGEVERDDKGRYKPRHRAESQRASAEDVPRIRELTRRLRETEAERDSLRIATRQPEPARTEPAKPVAAASTAFPPFDAWIAQPENAGKSFEDFIDARAESVAERKYRSLRDSERAEEARTTNQREHAKLVSAYQAQLTDAFYQEHPDFDELVDGVQVSKVVEHAALQVGPRVAYYLATHADERDALSQETEIDPTNPAFPAAVAAMRRYLATLVAPPQRSSSPSRQAAVSTGSAPARVPMSVPRPPNPVRTAALRDGDQPPGDESSLADHEKAYWTRRRA